MSGLARCGGDAHHQVSGGKRGERDGLLAVVVEDDPVGNLHLSLRLRVAMYVLYGIVSTHASTICTVTSLRFGTSGLTLRSSRPTAAELGRYAPQSPPGRASLEIPRTRAVSR